MRMDWTDSKFNGEPFYVRWWTIDISENEKIITQISNYWTSSNELETSLFFLDVDDVFILNISSML